MPRRRLEERERAGSTGAGRALPGEAAPGPSGPDPFRPVGSGPGCQLGAGAALLASGSAHPDRYPRFQACRLRCGDCLDAVETIECGIRKRLLMSESFPHDQIRGVLRGRRDCGSSGFRCGYPGIYGPAYWARDVFSGVRTYPRKNRDCLDAVETSAGCSSSGRRCRGNPRSWSSKNWPSFGRDTLTPDLVFRDQYFLEQKGGRSYNQ